MRETLNRAVGARRSGWPCLACCALLGLAEPMPHAQGVTTGSDHGIVVDAQKQPVAGASVIADPRAVGHELRSDDARGRTILDSQHARRRSLHRTVAYTGTGTAASSRRREPDVMVNLGVGTDLPITVRAIAVQETVTVTAQSRYRCSARRAPARRPR